MNNQQGISLIVVFLVVTFALTIVLGSSTVLFNKIKLSSSKEDSLSALYAAESGIEKTLYFDRKQIPGKGKNKGTRGLCNICNSCADCISCTAVALSENGCDPLTCTNCKVSYNSAFNGRTYQVESEVTSSSFFSCDSQGVYRGKGRTAGITSSSISSAPSGQ